MKHTFDTFDTAATPDAVPALIAVASDSNMPGRERLASVLVEIASAAPR